MGIDKTIVQISHFGLIWCLLLAQMLTFSTPYRVLLYLILILTVYLSLNNFKHAHSKPNSIFFWLLLLPFVFVLLDFVAVKIEFAKQARLISEATVISLSIWCLAKYHKKLHHEYIINAAILLLTAYVLAQCTAMLVFKLPYGTTKNPHYLAQYCALSIPVAIFCFYSVNAKLKLLLSILCVALGSLLIHTMSRPAWLALLLTGLISLIFLGKKNLKKYALLIVTIPTILYGFNVAGFGERALDLAQHITTEERVAIWQDDWKMQQASSQKQWIVGHGLNSFYNDFKPYSSYHLENIDFNSPHNQVLEVLYTSGIAGLFVLLLLYGLLYFQLVKLIKSQLSSDKNVSILLLALLTINLLFVAITVPFFRTYTLNVIAMITGAVLYMQEMGVNNAPSH